MIYIWVRSTLDWQDEAAFNAQIPSRLVEPVKLWNGLFKLPYHLFRHRIREIARLNHSRVEGAICSDWQAIPDDGLVVPVDDDDWFAPTLVAAIARERSEEFCAYFWPSQFLEVPVHLRHQLGRMRRRIMPAWSQPYRDQMAALMEEL